MVDYAELRRHATGVARQILERHSGTAFKVIIAPILLGGGLPARLVVDALLPYNLVDDVTPCRIQRYSAVGIASETVISMRLSAASIAGKILIGVDDFVDGGETMQAFVEHATATGAAHVETAVMFAKPHSTVVPDYVGEFGVTQWLVLPGEEHDFMHSIKQSDSQVQALNPAETAMYFEELGIDSATVNEWGAMPRCNEAVQA